MIGPATSRVLRKHFVWATKLFNGLSGGSFSEPFCSRVYRNAERHPGGNWERVMYFIDDLWPEEDHCMKANRAWLRGKGQ